MKQNFFFLPKLAALPMMFTALIACADDLPTDGFNVRDVNTSDCKERMNTHTRATIDEGEWIEYELDKREDGYYLHVKHVNQYFNCATLGAECSAKLEGNVITVDEREKPGSEQADCICPYDVTFDVGPLQEGEYTFVLTMYGYELLRFSVYVAERTNPNRISVDDYVAKIESLSTKPSTLTSGTSALSGIYDLRGRRYDTIPFPGIFIVDGKKVVRLPL